jgi:hypothetical protein
MTTTSPANVNSVKPPRMSFANVRSGTLDLPLRVLLYGVEGVGKSTFAARAPKPIFLGADAGTENLAITRLPEPKSWEEVFEAIRLLQNESHDYETLVVDPLNFLEPFCWAHLCAKNKWESIEDPGYGKGYDAALDEWRVFIAEVERLWLTRRMHIVFLAHVRLKLYKNPEGEDFERYTVPMHAKSADMLRAWCAYVLFAKHNLFALKDGKTKRVRGVSDGARVIHTQWNAAFDAKNRADLPPELPLSWDRFVEAVNATKDRESALRQQIADGVKELGDPEIAKKVDGYLKGASEDVPTTERLARLAEIANAVVMKLGERSNENTSTAPATGA